VGATGWIARRWFRRRVVAMVPLALLVIGATGTLVALGAADRTAGAYDEYVDRSEVGDVVLNPSIYTTEIDRLIRTLPGVERVTSDAFFTATLDDGAPRPASAVENPDGPAVFVQGSVDGRYVAMDRPALRAGRLPTGTNEALVSGETADAFDLDVGDVVPVSFWRPSGSDLPGRSLPDEVVKPIGSEQVELVGIGTFSDEVLPDGLYPRGRMIVSPDVAGRYACFPDAPPPGLSLEELVAHLLPDDCARSYQYFSLELTDGAAGIPEALAAFVKNTSEQNLRLGEDYDSVLQYFLIPTASPQEQARVDRATRPTVAALAVLGFAAAAVTVALAGLAVGRELRRSRRDQRQWWRLGMATPQRAGIVAAPMLASIAVGVIVAVTLAWLFSPIAPVGVVRSVDPSPARELTRPVILGAGVIALALCATTATLAIRGARLSARAGSLPRPRRPIPRWIERTAPASEVDGIRAASGGRSMLLTASAAVAVAVVVAAIIFGTSLSALVSTPRSFGWNWDIAAMTGFGYGDLDLDAATAKLDGDDDVESFAVLGFLNEISIDDEPVLSVIGLERHSSIDLTLVDGRLPTAADEVALGTSTAARHGVGVGDEVMLGGSIEPRRATVTGTVVFPALGPFRSDRVGTGTGMLLSETLFDPDEIRDLATFVAVDLADGADGKALDDLPAEMRRWDLQGAPALEYPDPVRPPEIVDARSMRAVPVLIVAFVGAVLAAGLAAALWASVRARRREFGILRALGFSGPHVRRSVRVQALVTMLGAIVIGLPIGVLAGRTAWRAFARQLGVVPDPAGAWPWLAAIAGVAFVIALIAAAAPAHGATRLTPAAALRAE
jgi:FtsX-like permease family